MGWSSKQRLTLRISRHLRTPPRLESGRIFSGKKWLSGNKILFIYIPFNFQMIPKKKLLLYTKNITSAADPRNISLYNDGIMAYEIMSIKRGNIILFFQQITTSSWLNQPNGKICASQIGWILPQLIFGVEIKKYLKLPPPGNDNAGGNQKSGVKTCWGW